jgi:hypothetical protein
MNDIDPQAWLADVLNSSTFFRELQTGTSAERRGRLNTRRLIESPG